MWHLEMEEFSSGLSSRLWTRDLQIIIPLCVDNHWKMSVNPQNLKFNEHSSKMCAINSRRERIVLLLKWRRFEFYFVLLQTSSEILGKSFNLTSVCTIGIIVFLTALDNYGDKPNSVQKLWQWRPEATKTKALKLFPFYCSLVSNLKIFHPVRDLKEYHVTWVTRLK